MKKIRKQLEDLLHEMLHDGTSHTHCDKLRKILADDWTNDPDQDGDDDSGSNQGFGDSDADSNPPGGPGGGHP